MIKIRKGTIKDIPKMIYLWKELMNYHETLDKTYYGLNKDALSTWKTWITKEMKKKNFFVLLAEKNNKVIGYANGSIQKRPPCFTIQKNGYVEGAVVSSKYRRKGITKMLMDELFKWFKKQKVKFIELRVYSNNKTGLATWRKLGFKEKLKRMYKEL